MLPVAAVAQRRRSHWRTPAQTLAVAMAMATLVFAARRPRRGSPPESAFALAAPQCPAARQRLRAALALVRKEPSAQASAARHRQVRRLSELWRARQAPSLARAVEVKPLAGTTARPTAARGTSVPPAQRAEATLPPLVPSARAESPSSRTRAPRMPPPSAARSSRAPASATTHAPAAAARSSPSPRASPGSARSRRRVIRPRRVRVRSARRPPMLPAFPRRSMWGTRQPPDREAHRGPAGSALHS